ncbi:MAG: hypothetical protein IKB23_08220 [Clostridia bacterium]|nr:hypothetical protein [Clostridia bacterium]
MEKIKKTKSYSLIIFCIVLLSNPNINVIDIMPDFIAWFILAHIFERAADTAPYFEEARVAFLRLSLVSLLKIPALLLILFVKSRDTLDNNIFALVSFSFAIFEIILLIGGVKNLFSAFFYLAERADAPALVGKFTNSKIFGFISTPEKLKNFTYLFFIIKTFAYVIPDFFMLTRVNDKGYIISGSPYYPIALLISVSVALIFGVIFAVDASKYAKAICRENKFSSALEAVASGGSAGDPNTKGKLRSILASLTLLCVTAFLSIELKFENFDEINILPHFIYGILLLLVCFTLRKHSGASRPAYLAGILFCIISFAQYITEASFLTRFEYADLLTNTAAQNAYRPLMILSVFEFIFFALFTVFFTRGFNRFITQNTGLSPESERYSTPDLEFHRSLKVKNYIMMSLSLLAGAARCINVILNSEVQILFTEKDTVTASLLPWFGTVVTVLSIAYIAYSFFYISSLKDEIRMKYESM